MYVFNVIPLKRRHDSAGFTMVEIAAALVILSIILSSVVVLMNRYTGAVIDLRLREQAFELARTNMEILLTETKVQEMTDYGTSETNPDLDWQTTVEPFYEPVTNRMWIRAVCSAGFDDSKGERQDVELEHWITNLTAAQIKQILAQQNLESEWMELLESGEYTDKEKTTVYCLEQQQLNVNAYKDFLELLRREKLSYLHEHGMDGWENFLKETEEAENEFLADEIGMDFDVYNDCAASYKVPIQAGSTQDGEEDGPGPGPDPDPCIDCGDVSDEVKNMLRQFGLNCC